MIAAAKVYAKAIVVAVGLENRLGEIEAVFRTNK
jgi:hypothetical protein